MKTKWITSDAVVTLICFVLVPFLAYTTSSINALRQDIAVINVQLKLLVKGYSPQPESAHIVYDVVNHDS